MLVQVKFLLPDCAFPGLEFEKGNLRPQKLILSFNDNLLFRQ